MVRTLAAALATSTCIVALATPAAAQTREYNIPAGSLKNALDAYVRQSGRQIVYRADEVRTARSPGVHGSMHSDTALSGLLQGSGFTTRADGNIVAIVKAGNGEIDNRPTSSSEEKQKQTSADQEILVVGTHIRGGNTPSPVVAFSAKQIREEGFTDLGEVIRSVPQNFSGGQNPGVMGVASGVSDVTGGSALNLRGLGADASLTLLNGHRLAYDGYSQAVDISAIPVEAVERLEIVPDGASAIYGSDAVGGVANVTLKRDFKGLTLGARYGGATNDGLATREYTATAGATWASGGLIATFKDTDADPIYARQRSYTKYLFDPYTIYPGNHSRSGLISAHQSLGEVAELRLDALRSKRDLTQFLGVSTDSYYRYNPATSITLVSPSIEFFLPHEWSVTLGGTYGKDETENESHFVSAAGSTLI